MRKIVIPRSSFKRRTSSQTRGATHRIEPGRGFVEEHDLRVVHERDREVEAAAHAAGVRADLLAERVTDVDQRGELGDALLGFSAA